ncbi:hypothetical protein CDD82_7482 [Ophiocordyceps australis]|uniref:Uncharacterized protein n=1 Tax=Ophiocordyceps australis TaxID=1399860 RepID=A0A2C5ZQ53_9HYPO|nr:hypothetical protein CDD82_7482 [Ophiocordyceps australis]
MFCYLGRDKEKETASQKRCCFRRRRELAVDYAGTTSEPFSATMPVPGPIPEDPMEKIKYHEKLVYNAREIQKLLNQRLTEKMEEDKKRDEAAKSGTTSKVNEEKEEANYGEDVEGHD